MNQEQTIVTQAIQSLEAVTTANITEQKARRRWRIFFILAILVLFALFIAGLFRHPQFAQPYDDMGRVLTFDKPGHIAQIDIIGEIGEGKSVNAQTLSATLYRAAANSEVKGIIINANSPGGSPVQSSLIHKAINDVRQRYAKPVIAVVTDTCASGCYYITSAADAIYADKSSIIGSIGVIFQSVGYKEAAQKLGLQPRTYTAGKNKDFFNPTREPTAAEITHLNNLLGELHQDFINAVVAGRQGKLSDDPELFSGLFWSGKKALTLGLIDGFATPYQVVRKMGGYPVKIYSVSSPWEQALQDLGANAQKTLSNGIQGAFSGKVEPTFQ